MNMTEPSVWFRLMSMTSNPRNQYFKQYFHTSFDTETSLIAGINIKSNFTRSLVELELQDLSERKNLISKMAMSDETIAALEDRLNAYKTCLGNFSPFHRLLRPQERYSNGRNSFCQCLEECGCGQ